MISRQKTVIFVVVGVLGIFYSRTEQIFQHQNFFLHICIIIFSSELILHCNLLLFYIGIKMDSHNLRGGTGALKVNECLESGTHCPTICVDGASCIMPALSCPPESFCPAGNTQAFECPFESNLFKPLHLPNTM